MHYGSSEEKDSEEEAGPQDRGGEEVDGEEDGHCSSQDRQEEEIVSKRRGGSAPRLLYFPLKNKCLPQADRALSRTHWHVLPRPRWNAAPSKTSIFPASLTAR
jgi:hypothetical protein